MIYRFMLDIFIRRKMNVLKHLHSYNGLHLSDQVEIAWNADEY
jgi:hypothetical protein